MLWGVCCRDPDRKEGLEHRSRVCARGGAVDLNVVMSLSVSAGDAVGCVWSNDPERKVSKPKAGGLRRGGVANVSG